jgi:hypothetical protein
VGRPMTLEAGPGGPRGPNLFFRHTSGDRFFFSDLPLIVVAMPQDVLLTFHIWGDIEVGGGGRGFRWNRDDRRFRHSVCRLAQIRVRVCGKRR